MERSLRGLVLLVIAAVVAVPGISASAGRAGPSRPPLDPVLQLTVEHGTLPTADGDVLAITATLTNEADPTDPQSVFRIGCAGILGAIVHPSDAFTELSSPSSQVRLGFGPGSSLVGTWTFRLDGPPPPAVTMRVDAFGAPPGIECPGIDADTERHHVLATWPLGDRPPFAPFAAWSALVERQHRDLLGRPASPAESSRWVAQLAAGTSTPADLVAELRRTSDQGANVDPTARLYRALLRRDPDPAGFGFWVARRRSGTWPLVRMADHLATSSEFRRRYGALTNRQFVARIYTDVLYRPPDPAGLDYWTRQLDLRRRSRGAVVVGFSESAEHRRVTAEATDAAVAHLLLLGRAPTEAEQAWWYRNLRDGVAQEELLTELLSSPGYAARIGSSATRQGPP